MPVYPHYSRQQTWQRTCNLRVLRAFMVSLVLFTTLIASLWQARPAFAHGNDDHEHAAPVATQVRLAPRVSAQSEDFELVAVLQGKQLTIYLDRFATNEAVSGAKIEVEQTGVFKLLAKETDATVYVLDLASLGDKLPTAVGKYPLTFTIETADTSDVLAASLEILPDDEEAHDHAERPAQWMKWLQAAALLSAAVILLLLWMRRKSIQHRDQPTLSARGEV